MVRVIVCGSRNWEGIWATSRIHDVMLALEVLAQAIGQKLEVVHGGCPTGADAIVDRWARRRGYEPIVFEANWAALGRAAGPVRNSAMALAGGDICVGFLKDDSSGTIDMMGKAKKYGITTFTVDWEEHDHGQHLAP